MKKALLLCAMSVCGMYTNAQYLDSFNINKSSGIPQPSEKNANPRNLITDGNTLYFYADDSLHSNQVWAKYKDSANPTRITDIKSPAGITPLDLTLLNDVLYFTVTDPATGIELWQHKNGQSSLVHDINPGNAYAAPQLLTTFKNRLFFRANSKDHGSQLWMHDPVSNITKRLTDTPSTTSAALNMAGMNNSIYFQGADNVIGGELYEYNIGTAKAQLVADIEPGIVSSDAENFMVWDNKLYFTAITSTHGRELHMYDGTNPPVRVTDLVAGPLSGVLTTTLPTAYKDCVYFVGDSSGRWELYKYDPKTQRSHVAYKLNPKGNCGIREMVVYNDNLFFVAEVGPTIGLWAYDGINPPKNMVNAHNGWGFNYLTATTQGLFFSGQSNVIGNELYRFIQYKLSVQNIAFNADVTAYPNPTKDISHIQLKLNNSQMLGVSVTDMNGRVIHSVDNALYSATTHTIDIPLNSQPAGTYMYSITDADGRMMASGKLQKL